MAGLPPDYPVPVVGIAAYSGTGKTTLLTRLIPLLGERGLRVGLIKHAHHTFDMDQPGKDSYELRKAGAERVLVSSRDRWVLLVERPEPERRDPELLAALDALPVDGLDLVIVEGFKEAPIPKIELRRRGLPAPRLAPGDEHVIAVAADSSELAVEGLPRLDLNRPEQIADFLIARLQGGGAAAP